jgi:hypothetical protein
LIQLYSRLGSKDDLARRIGNVMTITGEKTWHSLINELAEEKNLLAYVPDPDEIIPIIKEQIEANFEI